MIMPSASVSIISIERVDVLLYATQCIQTTIIIFFFTFFYSQCGACDSSADTIFTVWHSD